MPRAAEIRPAALATLVLALACLAAAAALSARSEAAGAKAVEVRGFAFRPATLTIVKGTRVTFTNRDGAPHTATDRGVFDTGRLGRGDSASVRFRKKGSFAYHCKLHPAMTGRIVVR